MQPYLILPKMEQLLEYYRKRTKLIIPRLAGFHIEFEGIGRTGRLLVNPDAVEKLFAG